jgi:hypothetical protein
LATFQEDPDSDDNWALSCSASDALEIEALQMGPSQALGSAETRQSHHINVSPELAEINPSPGLAIYGHIGRSLVLLLESP